MEDSVIIFLQVFQKKVILKKAVSERSCKGSSTLKFEIVREKKAILLRLSVYTVNKHNCSLLSKTP